MKIENLEETYRTCISLGNIREKRMDILLIKSLLEVSIKGIEFIKKISMTLEKESEYWTFVFRDYYESLRSLIEAFILFDGIEAESHQCQNAYICLKHPELEIDWEFLEAIRLRRNAVNYRGHLLSYSEWKNFHLNFDLHINQLQKEVTARLKQCS